MVTASPKLRLASLPAAEISGLVQAVPGLARIWAREANTVADWLERGRPRALTTLKVAMTRHNDLFVAALTHAGMHQIASAHDTSQFAVDAADRPRELALAAGAAFGPVAGLFLAAVAASDDPLADEVAARLQELRLLATGNGSGGQPAEAEPSEDDDSAAEPAAARPEWKAAETMLGRARDLLSLGSELAAALREAAVGVESGRPVTELADRLRDWSEAVRTELADAAAVTGAEDLTALSESLEDIIRQAREQAQVNAQEQRRRDALRGAEALQAEGLDHLIPGMLQAAGFGSLEELTAGSLSGTGAETSQAADMASRQDAPADEPRDDTETLPELTAAASEQPVDMDAAPRTPDAAAPATDGAEGPGPGAGESPLPAELAEAAAGPPAAPAGGQPDGTAHLEPAGAAAGLQDADLVADASEPAEHLPPVVPEPAGDAALPAAVTQQSASTAEGALPPAGDEEITFPWDLGTPPLLASLISQERDALAVCVSEAAQETAARQRLMRFFCAAFDCTPAGLELQLPDLIPPEDEVAAMGTDESRVLLAAALRAGLSLGYSPVGLAPLIDRADLDAGTRELIDAATEAVQHGYHRRGPSTTAEQAGLLRQWTAFAEEAQGLRESLGRRKIAFQRATNVLHHMVRLEEPVGHALGLVAELAARGVGAATADGDPWEESWSHIEKVASDLSSPGKRAKLITQADRAVSSAVQLRKPIIAGSKTRLEDSLLEAAGLLNRFCAARSEIRLSSQAEDLRLADDLFRAITPGLAGGEIASVGDAALQRLAVWLSSGAAALHAVSIHELVQAELEPLYEIPRDGDGNATRPGTLTEVSELVRGRETVAVMRGYLAIGNVAAARASIAKAGQADSSALDDEVLRGAKAARQRHEDALAAVERTAARLRAVYDDEAARNLTLRAEPFRVVPDDRFDLAIEPLRTLAGEGARQLSAFRDELRRRTESAGCSETDKQRILQLIDQQDEILAVEFLTLAESGRGLPSVSHQHGDDFSDFFPEMVNVAIAASRNGTDATEAVRTAAAAAGDPVSDPAHRQLAAGLDAWRELQTRKRGSDRFQSCVADVLRMLGLAPRAQTWLQEHSRTQRAGYATFRVRATPVDRSYVPSLGTQAHDAYDLTLAWDPVTPARLLDFIDERRRNEANIILYFGTLTPEQRLQLRRLTSHETGKGLSPLIVDEPVIGWLSARPEPGWRFTQRVTLPFTTLNPYTPFAGGDVPDEVFVGRESEREAIESPTGSMFVYGGRQLGKSALLRRVERLFTEPMTQAESGSEAPRTGRLAVYLDLKAAAIGEAQEPAALWAVLAQRLADTQILPKRRRGLGADEVTDQLATWLAADGTNRLLLLLDEADNFLTADFRAGRPGGGAEFPTLQRLKGLMELSGRRFKPIFAGLHQVQRFHDSSNTPVAHGGDDILVGPLRSMDAHRLVVDPMRVLGYEFAAPELVWRLLLFTNYQASLIQIVCEALVRQMQSRPLPAEGGRIVITSTDVESVYAKREVRDLIVQRFRWTINVDSRYRVIALVVAFRSFDVEPGETFTISELHDECEYFWPTGFSRDVLSSKEFQRYLEEMVGLGVLHRRDDQYGLRSPTIVGLLGTRQSLEDELAEVAKHLELPYEYNPTMNRRLLGQSAELGAPRSPLTDHDIATLLTQGSDTGGTVRIVTGSSALTVDRAAQVIRDVAEERQIAHEVVKPEGAEAAVAAARGAQHIIVDASSEPGADLPALVQVLTRRPNVSGTVIAGPQHLPLPQDVAAMYPAITIRRWSIEGLRSWYESPFATPELRKRLHRVTSGWPLLVERAMQEISNGMSPEAALTKIIELLGDPAFAREQILSCGIEVDLAVRWALWLSRTGPDGLPEATPANLADLTEALQADAGAVIDRLQDLDLVESAETGWVLDRVVLAAAVALQE